MIRLFFFLIFVPLWGQASYKFTIDLKPQSESRICDSVWINSEFPALPAPQVVHHGVPGIGAGDRVLTIPGRSSYASKLVVAEEKDFILMQALGPSHDLLSSLLIADDGQVVFISFEHEFKVESQIQAKVAKTLIEQLSGEVEQGGFFAWRVVDRVRSLIGDFDRAPMGRVPWMKSYLFPMPWRELSDFAQVVVSVGHVDRKILFHPHGEGLLFSQVKRDGTVDYAVLLLATGEARAVIGSQTIERVTDIPVSRARDMIEYVYQRATLGEASRAIEDFRELFLEEAPELLDGRWPDGAI